MKIEIDKELLRQWIRWLLILGALIFLLIFSNKFLHADSINPRISYIIPKTNSELWRFEFENTDLTKGDFHFMSWGFDYEIFLTKHFSLSLGVDSYNRQKMGTYNDYVGKEVIIENELTTYAFKEENGIPISHRFNVETMPFQFSIKICPISRKNRVIPYIGIGGNVHMYTVILRGHFVDSEVSERFFNLETGEYQTGYLIYGMAAYNQTCFTFGYHYFAGVMIPVSKQLSVDLGVKVTSAKVKLSKPDWYDPFDLNMTHIYIGLNYWR